MTIESEIASHYGRTDLRTRLAAVLAAAGRNVETLTLGDLAPIDQLHVRGLPATLELGAALSLSPEMRVLDVGSGTGGPSRSFASLYGCTIVGIDLTQEYCDFAEFIAEKLGLDRLLSYVRGSALDLPFGAETFDAAYTQHVAMNIEDKAGFYGGIARVLRPGAPFGIYDLIKGDGGDVYFPVPWARTQATSFLSTADELAALLDRAGFEIVHWRNSTAEALKWFDQLAEQSSGSDGPLLRFSLLMGEDTRVMGWNQWRNVGERRVIPAQVLCRKR
jgi:SAM-dependent methyltransferase